jgi:chemotaxis protein methyltransferase CheR
MITQEDFIIPKEENHSLEYISEWLSERTGMNFPASKQNNLYQRLQRVCTRLNIQNINEMARLLSQQMTPLTSSESDRLAPRVAVELVRAVSTNHTFFFREEETLSYFVHKIIPNLPADEPWRIWSAAAASGDEAYTIAILLAEIFGLYQLPQKVAILGTDISGPMIHRAEQGIYPDVNLEHVPENLRKRYFKYLGPNKWEIHPALKQICTFRLLNLKSHPFPFRQPFHLILSRNVFYYFKRSHQQELAEKFYTSAAPGGWLLTSVTESLHELRLPWKKITSGVWRKGEWMEKMKENHAETE